MHVRDLPPGATFDERGRLIAPKASRAAATPRAPRRASITIVPIEQGVRIEGLGLRTLANARLHHFVRARYVQRTRTAVLAALNGRTPPQLPCVIVITRRDPGRVDDDNATNAAKGVRDQVAKWLGVDDGDPRVVWHVRTDRGPRAVTIEWVSQTAREEGVDDGGPGHG
jgi:hypothetical protein